MTSTTFDSLSYFEKLVTKGHIDIRLAELKNDLLRWMLGMFIAQTGLIIAVIAFIK